jgi:hypothetical protein
MQKGAYRKEQANVYICTWNIEVFSLEAVIRASLQYTLAGFEDTGLFYIRRQRSSAKHSGARQLQCT